MRIPVSCAAAPCATARRRRGVVGLTALATVAVGFLLPRTAQSSGRTVAVVEIERSAAAGFNRGEPRAVRFEALGRRFDLAIERHDALVRDGVTAELASSHGRRTVPLPMAWIGRGEDGSEARLVIGRGTIDGFVRTSGGTFVVTPRDGGGRHEVRRAEDVLAEAGPFACATAGAVAGAPGRGNARLAPDSRDSSFAQVAGDSSPGQLAASTAPRVLEVSMIADVEYARRHGDGAVRDIVALLNTVDGIYRAELGIALQLVQLVVYTDEESQPFSDTTDYGTLLTELSLARSTNAALQIGAGGVTHLLTGRCMGSGVMGMTWLGGACDARYGVGYSAVDETTSYLAGIIVAHEIGHSLGAAHDGEASSGCEHVPAGYVMSPVLRRDVVEQFSDCSRSIIAGRLAQQACLAGQAPDGCGNGLLDVGEDCDASAAGDHGCCRADCRLAAAGLPCGESGEECFDARCNEAGECANVPNTAACTGVDACIESRCDSGACVATDVVRGFEELSARLRVSSQGTVESAKVSGNAPLTATGSDPSTDGVVFVSSLGGAPAWSEHIAADRWVSRGIGTFSYRADTAMPGRVKSAKIRMDARTGRATFRIAVARPMITMPPAVPEILVLSGDAATGQCATGVAFNCARKGGSYRCG